MNRPPLFIPLKREHFEAFQAGTKHEEYRPYGPRWNEKTCTPGRRVTHATGGEPGDQNRNRQTDIMHITAIKARGVKGRTFDLALATITAITGPNRSGKTAVRDAVILGLSGTHPDLPKTNQGIMRLASGPELDIDVAFSNGRRIHRNWTVGKGSKITAEATGDAAEAFLDNVPFAPDTFVAMGPTARVAYLAAMGDPKQIRESIEKFFGDDDAIMGIYDVAKTPLDALKLIEADLVERRRAAKQEADRVKAALKEASMNPPADTVKIRETAAEAPKFRLAAETLKKEAADLRTEIRDLNDKRKRIEAECERLGIDFENRVAVEFTADQEARLATLRATRTQAEGTSRLIAVLNGTIDEAENAFLDLETRQNLEAAVEAYDGDIATLGPKEVHDAKERAEASRETVNRLQNQLERVQGRLDNATERAAVIEARIEQANQDQCCPTCGQRATGEMIAAKVGADLQAAKEEIKRLMEERDATIEASTRAIQDAGDDRERHRILNAAFKASIDLEAERVARERHEKATEDLRRHTSEFAASFTEADAAELARLEAAKKTAEAAAGLETWSPDDAVTMATARHRLESVEKELEDVTVDLRIATEAESAVRDSELHTANVKRLTEESETADDRTTKAKDACEKLNDAKRALLAAVWAPIIDAANTVLRATYGDDAITAEFTDSEFGLTDDAGFRPFDVLSGSEQTVFTLALSIGLATKQPARIALVDEIARLDANAVLGFVQGIETLIAAGRLDQALLFGHSFPDTLPKTVPIIAV